MKREPPTVPLEHILHWYAHTEDISVEEYLRIHYGDLTLRQRVCAALKAEGYTYEAIGNELGISKQAAWKHVRACRKKVQR